MDIGAFGKGKGKQSKSKHGKGKGKGKQGQEEGFGRMLELWKARTLLERLLEQEEHQQRWFEGEIQTQECRCSQS